MILSAGGLGLLVAGFVPLGSLAEIVTVNESNLRGRSLRSGPMEMPCMLLKVDKESTDHFEEDNVCFCELQGSDVGDEGFKVVELIGIPPQWCNTVVQPGRTELLPGGLIIDDEIMICNAITTAPGMNCWDQLVWNNQIKYQDSLSDNLNQLVSSSMGRSLLSGERTVLVLRGIAADRSAPAADELSDAIFGTNGDPFNLRSQYAACSYGQLNFVPAPNLGVNGVYEADFTSYGNASGSDERNIRREMYRAAHKDLGDLPSQVDHVMACLPPGTNGGWVAFAIVDHWFSWFNDLWCTYASVQIHEMGHNLGLSHSGHSTGEYDDQSGMMGYSYSEDDLPKMCFNGQKTYDLGWFSDYNQDFHSGTFNGWYGDLVGFVDRDNAGSRKMIIRMTDDVSHESYYIHFNRKAGFNSGTFEGGDRVLISCKGPEFAHSVFHAALGVGHEYSISDFGGEPLNIKVDSIEVDPTLGDGVLKASISISVPSLTAVGDLPNIALNKLASQGSTSGDSEASKAVDGSHDSSTHTAHDDFNWWEVDLGMMSVIKQINVYNRRDCCRERLHGAVVKVLDIDRNVVGSGMVKSEAPDVVEFNFKDLEGRYVRIDLDTNYLHVSEVEVYGFLSNHAMPNLALNKLAEQSTTAGNQVASLAVDGDPQTFTHTSAKGGRWVVDLEAVAIIRQIKIYNRQDSCQDRIHGAFVSILDYNNESVMRWVISEKAPDVVEFNVNDVRGQYVEIWLHTDQWLNIGEVEVYGTLSTEGMTNLALNKPAEQSTTANNAVASLAVDGDPESFTHSALKNSASWWQVNLEAVAQIRQIKIYNRPDCCAERFHGAVISILDSDENVVEYKNVTGAAPMEMEFNFQDTEGKFVRIDLNTDFLSVAEVEVFGNWQYNGMQDLALNMPATMSSTVPGYVAASAVDGNAGTSIHSWSTAQSSWSVDLLANTMITHIKIINRPQHRERLHGAFITIRDENDNVLERRNVVELTSLGVQFSFQNVVGRHVGIEQNTNYLHVIEVEVYGFPV